MKLTTAVNVLGSRQIEKNISKKILLANTASKITDKNARKKAVGVSQDPIYNPDGNTMVFNPDIRYRNTFAFSPLTNINYRNDLIVFAENFEIKKAVKIIATEIAVTQSETHRYPVFPKLTMVNIPESKKETALAIQDYLDRVFWPKLWQWYTFKGDGFIEKLKEFIITGKIAYEIFYDNLKNPKAITGMQPIDPGTLQKFKVNDNVYYVQRAIGDNGKERVMADNQVILCEFNKYDFGYVSYVDTLRMAFNIMRSMQTSKILWFAAKSQVRMHINLAMGEMAYTDAINEMLEQKNLYTNHYTFDDSSGTVLLNGQPNNSGYREFTTVTTNASGEATVEEVNSNGPDLTEVESLGFWKRFYWECTEIPMKRVDPQADSGWGFADVNSLNDIEVQFGKMCNAFRQMVEPIFIKPIIMELTLKEIEIGVDLSLLDSIHTEWVTFNQYEKLAELEILNKKVEIGTNLSQFGEMQDVNDKTRKRIPIMWISDTVIGFTKEQNDSMDQYRKDENVWLGFNPDGTVPETEEDADTTDQIEDEKVEEEPTNDDGDASAEEIMDAEDSGY